MGEEDPVGMPPAGTPLVAAGAVWVAAGAVAWDAPVVAAVEGEPAFCPVWAAPAGAVDPPAVLAAGAVGVPLELLDGKMPAAPERSAGASEAADTPLPMDVPVTCAPVASWSPVRNAAAMAKRAPVVTSRRRVVTRSTGGHHVRGAGGGGATADSGGSIVDSGTSSRPPRRVRTSTTASRARVIDAV